MVAFTSATLDSVAKYSLAITTLVLVTATGGQDTGIAHRKFEYKYSFKGPYLSQKDGSVPFWEYSGSTIASEDMVRITPSLRSKKGSIWSKFPTTFPWWEVEVTFRVNGRGRLGADGLAFWFTSQKLPEGDTFGSADPWHGLGLFFDSFDNDNRNNNPYIMAMLNDGTKKYDHQTDGISQQLAGCQRDFRNKPFPVKAKIEYFKNVLAVSFHGGNTNTDDDYELCLRVENVVLPANGYIGLSAATGGLADDHDVLRVLTTSLYDSAQAPQQMANNQEMEKSAKEYDAYKAKLEQQKEEYRKQHPDAIPIEPEQAYESQQNQELRQIFESQNHMYEGMKSLHRKLDELLGRQERTMSMVGMIQQGGVQVAHQQPLGQPGFQPPPVVMPIQRHEVEALLEAQRDLSNRLEAVRKLVDSNQQRPAGGSDGVDPRLVSEMRDTINIVKRDVANVASLTGRAMDRGCPQVSCLGPGTFIAFTCVNLFILLGYMVYRNSKSDAAKKFY